jgi:hypothetical protein
MHVRRHGNIIQVQKVRQMDIFTSYSLLAGGDGTAKVIVIALPKMNWKGDFMLQLCPTHRCIGMSLLTS